MADPKPNHRTILRLLPSGQVVPTPRRIECEPLEIHEARCAAVKKLGVKWVMHPAYVFDPRHSNDPEVYGPARAQFLAAIGHAAASDRRANKMFQKAEDVRAAIGGKA